MLNASECLALLPYLPFVELLIPIKEDKVLLQDPGFLVRIIKRGHCWQLNRGCFPKKGEFKSIRGITYRKFGFNNMNDKVTRPP